MIPLHRSTYKNSKTSSFAILWFFYNLLWNFKVLANFQKRPFGALFIWVYSCALSPLDLSLLLRGVPGRELEQARHSGSSIPAMGLAREQPTRWGEPVWGPCAAAGLPQVASSVQLGPAIAAAAAQRHWVAALGRVAIWVVDEMCFVVHVYILFHSTVVNSNFSSYL